MKYKHLLASILTMPLLISSVYAQSLKPGTAMFQNIYGVANSQNVNTGIIEEVTDATLLTEGFVVSTNPDAYLDILFSNGVVGRLSPDSKIVIESFLVSQNPGSATETAAIEEQPVLKLKLEYGDIILNGTAKSAGDFVIETPISEIKAGTSKFFVSYGLTSSQNESVSRTINLGTDSLQLTSNLKGNFSDIRDQVIYGYYDPYASPKTAYLYNDNSAVIRTAREDNVVAENTSYSLLPVDEETNEELETVADYVLAGGPNPTATILILQSDPDSTYYDVNTGETGAIQPGMKLPEGTIIRTSVEGLVSFVYPNGTTANVESSSNVYIESIMTQPVLNKGDFRTQTNVTTRVETGLLSTNTSNTPEYDTVTIISPLDMNLVPPDTVLSVEFKQIETSAFQTITKNLTPATNNSNYQYSTADAGEPVATVAQTSLQQGKTPFKPVTQLTTVITSNALSFVQDGVSFVEYTTGGSGLSFSVPPGGTHITESRIIPPTYAFIDRTIAFAASVVPGPTPVGTPDNPGNNIQTGDEDPVSP